MAAIEATLEVAFCGSDHSMTADEADRLEKALKVALEAVYPGDTIRGLWAHSVPESMKGRNG